MTVDERQIRDAFRASRHELALTDQDIQRMHADLHERMRVDEHPLHRKPSPRRRFWVAAAAVLAILVVVGAMTWARRSQPPRPAEGSSPAVVGVWKGIDPAFAFMVVLRADGSLQSYSLSNGLLSRSSVSGSTYTVDAGTGRYRVSGQTVEIANAEDPGRDCAYGFTGQWIADGQLRLTQASESGTDCGSPLPPVTLIRVSPASPVGVTYTAAATSPLSTATVTNQLAGAWLLRGTGVLLAVGWTIPPAGVQYSLDGRGTIDTAAEEHGVLTVPSPGRILLTSLEPSACQPIVLQAASAGDYALTARVEADSCHRFHGQADLTFTRLQ